MYFDNAFFEVEKKRKGRYSLLNAYITNIIFMLIVYIFLI